MGFTRPTNERRSKAPLVGLAAGLVAVLAFGACTTEPTANGSSASPSGSAPAGEPSGVTAEVGTLPPAAQAIMAKPPYQSARWLYYVADADTGEVLLANRADEMVFTGSTAKEFTVGTVYEVLGPDTTLTTPVYSTVPVADGAVGGDLVLVASGDLALGGRNAMEGRFDHTFSTDTVDHVYANIAPNGARVGDPLAGLDDLAQQVADAGVTRIDGDVVIDTRLWETYAGQDGPVPPVYVNDNLLDIQVTAAGEGSDPSLVVTPATSALTVTSTVTTVGADGETALVAEVSPTDPTVVELSGTIAADTAQLTTFAIDDAGAWARSLFIEALERAGVTVAAPVVAPNDEAGLPPTGGFASDQELASLESPPISALGTMILETSYNKGSNAFMCLLAVEQGSTDCEDGLTTIYDIAETAGVDTDVLLLIDGQGKDPASTTPRQVTRWVQWAREQSWGDLFMAGQPVLAETGSLAPYGAGTPSAGKVAAKAGTSAGVGPANGRLYSNVQTLSGYLFAEDGRVLVFGLSMSGGTYPSLYDGLVEAGADVADVAASFQQSL